MVMVGSELQGIFGVVPTPLTRNGSVDEAGLRHLVAHCRESGLHGAVILGSNGEWPYFLFEEKKRVLRVAAEAAEGLPLIAGASAFSTDESVMLARIAREAGYAAVLAALPVYFAVELKCLVAHFSVLAQDGGLPVLFYYWPEVTGLNLSPDEIAELAAIDGVVGAKLSVANRSFVKRVIHLTRTQLWAVFAGTSFMMRFALKEEAAGVICPLPLIAPKDCLELYAAMEAGDLDRADKIQDLLLGALPIFTGTDEDGAIGRTVYKALLRKPYTGPGERPHSTIALVKEALRLQGHPITAVVRAPCGPLTPEHSEVVARTLRRHGWLSG
jgi:2-dehydro-3-deoxy-D-pentonate aldolase